MDAYVPLILLALLGFLALAVIVLLPFYLFLQREKKVCRQWTPEILAQRYHEAPPSPNGASQHDMGTSKTTTHKRTPRLQEVLSQSVFQMARPHLQLFILSRYALRTYRRNPETGEIQPDRGAYLFLDL